jgi:hypothetical protein
MHAEALHQCRARRIQADDLDRAPVPARLQRHAVERADGRDVPEMRGADVDDEALDLLLQVEGVGKHAAEAKNTYTSTR